MGGIVVQADPPRLVLARDLVLLALVATLVRVLREPARGSSRTA